MNVNQKTTKVIHGAEVSGTNLDAQTRCLHYDSAVDIIAIKFKCCRRWFPCYQCHAEHTDHSPEVWASDEAAAIAVLCGRCGHRLSIAEYLRCASICPGCGGEFNPGCARHYDLYFEQPI